MMMMMMMMYYILLMRSNTRIIAAYLLNKFDSRLKIKTEVDESPLNAFALVFFLFKLEHRVVEQLLQLLVCVVDAQLLK